MNPEAQAHITAEQRLRTRTEQAVAQAWRNLPSYDEEDVPAFLAVVVPLMLAAQRASATLTNAFLARRLGRSPLPLNPALVTGSALRAGTTPAEVYRRPFVTTWTSLKDGQMWDDAVLAGLERATSAAAMDVQLAMRQTLVVVGEQDPRIVGFQRVPDADACDFCKLVSGQRYLKHDLMAVHNRCGCGVDVITSEDRDLFTGSQANDLDLDPSEVRIEEHGELGPVLVGAGHDFTRL